MGFSAIIILPNWGVFDMFYIALKDCFWTENLIQRQVLTVKVLLCENVGDNQSPGGEKE